VAEQDDREGVLAPLDPEAILRTLDRHGVRYVLVGGLAAVAHGWPGVTLDADITPSTDRQNLVRLTAALREMDTKLRVPGLEYGVDIPLDERTFDLETTWTFITRHGPLEWCSGPMGRVGTPTSRQPPSAGPSAWRWPWPPSRT
jgi:hypothetical protein